MQFRISLSLFVFIFFINCQCIQVYEDRVVRQGENIRFHVLTAVKYFVEDMEIFTSFLKQTHEGQFNSVLEEGTAEISTFYD